jgi:hypothetical protein
MGVPDRRRLRAAGNAPARGANRRRRRHVQFVPATPSGVGTQQVMIVYLLHETVSTAHALAFSIGMQARITAVNTLIGLTAMMLIFRTVRPVAAVRAVARATGRAERGRSGQRLQPDRPCSL